MFNNSKVIDAVTVLDNLRRQGNMKSNLQSYIIELMNITPTAANVLEYAAIVRDKALLRNIAGVSSDVSGLVYSGEGSAGDVLEIAEQKIYALRQGRTRGGLIPIGEILPRVFTDLKELSEGDGKLPGYSTGYSDLDHKILGLNKSDLILLASRPGMGKTSFALNIAANVAKKSNKTIAVFSLEMSRDQLVLRMLSSEAFIENKKLLTGKLSDEEWRKLGAAAASLSRTDIRIDDTSTLTVSEMNAECRRLDNLGLVIIDYLQLMSGSGSKVSYSNENRTQVVSDMSRMMKVMAKELSVPVLCLSQLNRASAERSNKRPLLSDLRESGSIEQDADIVIGLYRDDYYNAESESHNLAECIIMKNRHGETGTVNLQWLPQYTSYASVDTTHYE
jgi:replicative DNA helicase